MATENSVRSLRIDADEWTELAGGGGGRGGGAGKGREREGDGRRGEDDGWDRE